MSFTPIKHPYIIKTIEDLDSIFIYKENYFDDFSKLLEPHPSFARKAINCWYGHYIPKFDYLKFDTLINHDLFKQESEKIIDELKQSYLEKLDDKIEETTIVIKINLTVKRYYDSIIKSLEFLSKTLKTETYNSRKILAVLFLNSFEQAKKTIEENYSFVSELNVSKTEIPSSLYNNLSRYIYDDDINNLKELEQKLIDNNYLKLNSDSTFSWVQKKTELVDFIRVLKSQKHPIMRRNIDETKGFKFFEKRYNTDLDTLRRKSKYEIRPLKLILKFDFLFE